MDININFGTAIVDALNRIAESIDQGFAKLIAALPSDAADQAVIDEQVAKLRQITASVKTIIPDTPERV